ncbi:MAG: serine/threonine-protein kinase [Pseudomonadota bacterium]
MTSHALHAGTRLGEFEILELIGQGGFGIVYLAYDHSLQRKIALKEYMPEALAARTNMAHVTVRSEHVRDAFKTGLRSFINEARLLAHFDHPSLVKVFRFWEENGTAYMAMPFYEGVTLKQVLRNRDVAATEEWLKQLCNPVLDALDFIHRENCFHRDVAPDNILVLGDGHPMLLDFGAARQAISGLKQDFTVILKQGYAPVEQYAEIATMQQGAWTDIYALASVLHFAIAGVAPLASISRLVSDTYTPLSARYAGKYGSEFLRAIDQALAVLPQDRPQTIAEFRQLLGIPKASSAIWRTGHASPKPAPAPVAPVPEVGVAGATRPRLGLAGLTGIAALAVLLAGGFAYYRFGRGPATPAPAAAAVVAAVDMRLAEAPLPAKAAAASATLATAVPQAMPPQPIKILNEIFTARDVQHAVAVTVDEPRVRIGRDALKFSVQSSKGGYVYLLMLGTDPAQFWLLFPNKKDGDNLVGAGKRLSFPRPSFDLTVQGPAGIDQLLVIVSDSPRDFSSAGFRMHNNDFAEFSAANLGAGNPAGTPSLHTGTVKCAGNKQPCSEAFGAAMFTIEEVEAH